MQTHYVFVDYENTQLGNIDLISECRYATRIKMFLNHHQTMIPVSVARALHALGDNAEYIQIDSGRRNVIEFHIAFQLGELATQHPEARFSILSNDTGFDEIAEGLRMKGIDCARFADMETLLHLAGAAISAMHEAAQGDKVVVITESRSKPKGIPAKNTTQR